MQARVRIRVAVRELVDVILAVEIECKRQHVILAVIRASIVIDVLRWNAAPASQQNVTHLLDALLFAFASFAFIADSL